VFVCAFTLQISREPVFTRITSARTRIAPDATRVTFANAREGDPRIAMLQI
jgi:hypothetical protein